MKMIVLLLLAFSSAASVVVVVVEGTWCIAKTNVGETALQKSLDYACGAGAYCLPIQQNGACYQPNTVSGHASYAMNSYFQKMNQASTACDFSGTATITTTDPSYGSCSYPATASAAGGTNTTSTTPSSTTSSSSSTTGGITPVLGPTSINNDFNSAAVARRPAYQTAGLLLCTFAASTLLISRYF